MNTILGPGLAGVLALACGGGATAETTLRSASAFGPTHIQATALFATLGEKIAEFTDGAYGIRDFPSGLAAPGEMVTAMRDSVVDMGSMVLPYFPADFPESLLPSNLSIFGENPVAISLATTEYIVTCAECQAEFARVGQVYLGSGWTPAFQVQTTRPAETLENIQGVRLRVAGSVFSEWAEYVGAQPVQLPSSEIFQAMSEGIVDGFFGNLPDMMIQQIQTYVTDITMVNFGTFNGDSISLRAGLWQDLTPDDRSAFIRAAMVAREAGGEAWSAMNEQAKTSAAAEGIVFHEPSEDLQEKLDAFRDHQLEAYKAKLDADGIHDGAAKIDRYLGLVEKWEDILATADGDVQSMVDLKMQEIWSKVDLQGYGG
ncbi:MAG: TRAP transporter substrate-binding protein DctP [Pseudomonadota bacterium]|nr:TRAP transporter substrate-binding protein DctP [Pseudomonadota bacterium]